MKHIHKLIAFAAFGAGMCLTACEDVELGDPNTTTTASNSYANFVMVNASPDAPALDLFVNNIKTGTTIEAGAIVTTLPYTNVYIASNGVLSNTNIRVKATAGTIGGTLGTSNLIYRSTNNGTNNFQAADSAYYTFIVLDSVNRPKPIRTLNADDFGDITYYSPEGSLIVPSKLDPNVDTTIVMSVGSNNSTVTANLIKKYNGGVFPSYFLPIGTVPLGSTDAGGVRFLVITDQLPLPSSTRFPKPTSGKFAVRFINASPDAGTVTISLGATAVTSGFFSYPFTQANFNPSVGSRTLVATSATNGQFQNNFANQAAYDIVVKSGTTEIARLNAQDFSDKGVYTIVMSGKRSSVPLKLTVIKNK